MFLKVNYVYFVLFRIKYPNAVFAALSTQARVRRGASLLEPFFLKKRKVLKSNILS
jgi:hypothetical protein